MKPYKLLAVIAIAIFMSIPGYSQDMRQGEPSAEIERKADKAIEMWNQELSLRAKQAVLMEEKIIEFEMKKEEVLQSKMNEAAKKESLLNLQAKEAQEMRNILTKPQYEKYIAVLSEQLRNEENK